MLIDYKVLGERSTALKRNRNVSRALAACKKAKMPYSECSISRMRQHPTEAQGEEPCMKAE